MTALKVGLVIGNQALWDEVHECLTSLPVRVVIEQPAVGDIEAFGQQVDTARLDVFIVDLTRLDQPFENLLRRVKGGANPPMVVALHNRAEPEIILSAMRAGASEFLYPPIGAGLHKALDRLAADRKKNQSSTRQRGRTIGFLSVKGGCGATTIACHIASEIERATNSEILLADMDLESGMVGFVMKAKAQYSILDAVRNVHRLDQSYWNALIWHGSGNLDVVTAPPMAGLREPLTAEPFHHVLQFVRSNYDWVVVDLGRSLNQVSLGVLEALDEVYLVSVLDLPALHQAKQVIQCLLDTGFSRNHLRLLMNRMPKRPDFAPGEVQRALGLPIWDSLPNDYPVLYQAYAEGTLLPATSELAKALSAVAGKICGVQVTKEKAKQRSALSLFQF